MKFWLISMSRGIEPVSRSASNTAVVKTRFPKLSTLDMLQTKSFSRLLMTVSWGDFSAYGVGILVLIENTSQSDMNITCVCHLVLDLLLRGGWIVVLMLFSFFLNSTYMLRCAID
jgi:hypothetical protein